MAKKKKKRQPANGARESKSSGTKKDTAAPQPFKASPPQPNKPLLYVTGGLFFLFLTYLFVIALLVQFGYSS